jgi:tRNA(Arg) A34 adenosine deaminase TadA
MRLHGLTEYAYKKYNNINCSKNYIHLCFYIPYKESWNNLVAYGENNTRRCSKGLPSMHAEIDGLRRMKIYRAINPKSTRESYDIVVIRFSKSGKLGISRPCLHCLRALYTSNINIKHVYYSTGNDQEIVRESLIDMINDDVVHISSGWRQKMGINHKDYCTHIIKEKLDNDDRKETYAKSVFKQYLEERAKKCN